jgi:hypothetical protein
VSSVPRSTAGRSSPPSAPQWPDRSTPSARQPLTARRSSLVKPSTQDSTARTAPDPAHGSNPRNTARTRPPTRGRLRMGGTGGDRLPTSTRTPKHQQRHQGPVGRLYPAHVDFDVRGGDVIVEPPRSSHVSMNTVEKSNRACAPATRAVAATRLVVAPSGRGLALSRVARPRQPFGPRRCNIPTPCRTRHIIDQRRNQDPACPKTLCQRLGEDATSPAPPFPRSRASSWQARCARTGRSCPPDRERTGRRRALRRFLRTPMSSGCTVHVPHARQHGMKCPSWTYALRLPRHRAGTDAGRYPLLRL